MYVGVVLLKCLFISAARPDRSSIQYLSACTKYVHPFFILFYFIFFFFFFFFCFLMIFWVLFYRVDPSVKPKV